MPNQGYPLYFYIALDCNFLFALSFWSKMDPFLRDSLLHYPWIPRYLMYLGRGHLSGLGGEANCRRGKTPGS